MGTTHQTEFGYCS